MLVGVYCKLSLFNAHARILFFHVDMNINKLLNLTNLNDNNKNGSHASNCLYRLLTVMF